MLKEHWQCDVCHKYFNDANATQEVSYASLLYPAYAEFDESTGTLTFKCGLSKPAGAYDLNEGSNDPAWYDQRTNIKKVVFDASFANARPTSCYEWFYNCNNLTKIEGIENLNTVNVTNMKCMFWGCSGLTSLDLSKFDTQKVTNMSFMFAYCSSLTSLDISKFDTQKVTNMGYMFSGCSKLTSLNLSKFNTQNVTSMGDMFSGCSALTSLDLSKFDTQNVTEMTYMFDGCSGLTSLDLSKFDTQKVTNMRYMFNGCSALTSLDLSKFDTQNVEHMTCMFNGCSALTTIYVSDKFVTTKVIRGLGDAMFGGCTSLKGATAYSEGKTDQTYANYKTGYFTLKPAYAEFDESTGTLTFKYGLSKPEGAYDLNEGNSGPAWSNQSAKINKVVFDASFANARPTSCKMWFYNCNNLTEFEGIANLNTEEVTSMDGMFTGCSGLTSLDLSNFNTQKVTNMFGMFKGCSKLTSLDLSKFDTQNVTNMSNMFCRCEGLTSLDVSKFNTQNVTEMSYMFYGCSALTSLDLSKFDTQNVTEMNGMFNGCSKLTLLDLSKFDTQNVTYMHDMFSSCSGLTSLDLSKFDTQKVTNMRYMFNGCSALTSLDLSKFNTQKVTDMTNMFYGCSDLTTIYVSDKFVTTNVNSGYGMFGACTSLKGAIAYDASKIDHAYANYKTGYFTPECAYAEFDEDTGTLTFKCGLSKPEGAYDLNEGDNAPEWIKGDRSMNDHIKNVVFDASFANARPTSCKMWFYKCNNLTEIEGIANLNTEEVTNMEAMFSYCSGLTSLDLSKFDTQNVTNMDAMFYVCSKLTLLNLSKFDTQNVTNMGNMFRGCSALTSLDLSKFNTQNVTNMVYMFSGCSKLTLLNLSKFNTQNVTDMYEMFSGCSGLTSLDLSNFDTQNLTSMSYMFSWCAGLNSLDLSKFDTQNVEDMSKMFYNCSALATIYVSDKFVTTKVNDGYDMFSGCTSLKGAIVYDASNTDRTCANYKTGYFTKLVGKNGNDKIGAVGEVLTAESLELADDKDFEAYEPFTATAATYNREMKAGTTWATLCLPFEVSLADQNFRAFQLLSADETTNTVELKEITTSIAAGTPVIIKMKEEQTTLSFSVANKEIANNVKTTATADGSYQLQGLYTKKVFDKDADNNCYIVKGNKLMNPTKLLENTNTKLVGSKAFRAYMKDNSQTIAAGAKMFSIGFDDSTTAIDNLNTIADDNAIYYDLQGKRLNEPQKGINIVKRGNKTMKVVIK